MSTMRWFAAGLVLTVTAGLLCGCSKPYVCEPEDIHEISKLAIGLPIGDAVTLLQKTLQERYPGKFRSEIRWHFNRTGGTLGEMALLYASTREYVLIFGTPIGSEGFSGRYALMDVYDCMFAGVMWTYTEGQLERTEYLPGDCAVLERGHGKGYFMEPGTWMLEYSRGFVPACLPIGLFAPVSVTMDFQNMWGVFWDYAGLVLNSMVS